MVDNVARMEGKYLQRVFIMMVLIASSLPIAFTAGIVLWVELHSTQEHVLDNQDRIKDNQQLLKDCVDRRRVNSDCQQYSRERTDSAVSVLADITEAYVLCADKFDGDTAIKQCVARRLDPAAQAEDAG